MEVWLLHHIRELGDDVQEVKFIGVYSTEDKGQAAIERLRLQPGFADYPDGFELESARLDQDSWVEGFAEDIDAH